MPTPKVLQVSWSSFTRQCTSLQCFLIFLTQMMAQLMGPSGKHVMLLVNSPRSSLCGWLGRRLGFVVCWALPPVSERGCRSSDPLKSRQSHIFLHQPNPRLVLYNVFIWKYVRTPNISGWKVKLGPSPQSILALQSVLLLHPAVARGSFAHSTASMTSMTRVRGPVMMRLLMVW